MGKDVSPGHRVSADYAVQASSSNRGRTLVRLQSALERVTSPCLIVRRPSDSPSLWTADRAAVVEGDAGRFRVVCAIGVRFVRLWPAMALDVH
jgi:hypothetical protein